MVKHNQAIRRLLLTNCLSVVDHFVGLVLEGLLLDIRLPDFMASQHVPESQKKFLKMRFFKFLS